MLNILKYVKKDPFTDKEILRLVQNRANLVLYPDISVYRSIDDLMGVHRACIILYITSMTSSDISGHWTCIFRVNKTTLEWFDPYGLRPDEELDFSDPQYSPYLTRLLAKSNYNIIYNKTKLQDPSYDIATCGRHVGLRLQLRTVPLPQYVKLFLSVPNLTPDDIATLMTAFVN